MPTDIVQHLRFQLEAKEERLVQIEQHLRRHEAQIRNLPAALTNSLQRSHSPDGCGDTQLDKYL